jgi:hypothetical protein
MDDEEDGARRIWTYGKGQWSGKLLQTGGDEYGNSTVVLRLPQGRALILAWNIPLRRDLEPSEGRIECGLVDVTGHAGTWDNPLPMSYLEAKAYVPEDGITVVARHIWYGPWKPFREV